MFDTLLDCNQRTCKRNPITQCACYSIWASEDAKDVNPYCQNLNDNERNALSQVTIWTAKNQLKLLPQINRWDRQHLMSGLSENLTLTLASPTDGDTLKQIFEDFSHELNYIKEYDNSTENEAAIGNITYMLNNFDHYDQLAEIINQINGFFSLGKSCSFNSEIGSKPTVEEFCHMKMGKTILKNVMPCEIRQMIEDEEEHDS